MLVIQPVRNRRAQGSFCLCASCAITSCICNFNLSGTLPSQLGLFSKLETLDLWNNVLSGRIPSQLGHLTQRDPDLVTNTVQEHLTSATTGLLGSPEGNAPAKIPAGEDRT